METPTPDESAALATAASSDARQLEHDIGVYRAGETILAEQTLWNILSNIENDHSYDRETSSYLWEFLQFLALEQNQFLDHEIVECSQNLARSLHTLLSFLGRKFFVFPRKQQAPNVRYCMHPELNCDREGSGTPEESRKYSLLASELEARVNELSQAYRSYRRAIKRNLYI